MRGPCQIRYEITGFVGFPSESGDVKAKCGARPGREGTRAADPELALPQSAGPVIKVALVVCDALFASR